MLDYNNNQIGGVYHRLWSYMGRDQNIGTGLQVSEGYFKELYPIYYFSLQHLDLSKQLTVNITFQACIGDALGGFRVVAIILSDKSRTLEGCGGKMRVVDVPVENVKLRRHVIRQLNDQYINKMSYGVVSIELTPGQIKKLQGKSAKNSGTTILLKPSRMAGGEHTISLRNRQVKHSNDVLKNIKEFREH